MIITITLNKPAAQKQEPPTRLPAAGGRLPFARAASGR